MGRSRRYVRRTAEDDHSYTTDRRQCLRPRQAPRPVTSRSAGSPQHSHTRGLLKFESRVLSIKNGRIRCFLLIQLQLETRVLILETRYSIKHRPNTRHRHAHTHRPRCRVWHFSRFSTQSKTVDNKSKKNSNETL